MSVPHVGLDSNACGWSTSLDVSLDVCPSCFGLGSHVGTAGCDHHRELLLITGCESLPESCSELGVECPAGLTLSNAGGAHAPS